MTALAATQPPVIVAIVAGAYLAAVLLLGEVAARRGKATLDDYLVAGRGEGTWMLSATVAATVIGAGSTIGAAGAAYYVGVSAAWYLWSATLGLALLAVAFARHLRASGVYTVPELLERRYGPRARALAAALGLVGLVFFLAAQFFTLGTLLQSLSGLSVAWGIVAGGAVTAIYTSRGGSRAVHWSDALQTVFIVVGLAVTAGVALRAAGGFDAFVAPPPTPQPRGGMAHTWFNPYTGAAAHHWNPLALGSAVIGWVVMSTTWHFTMQSTAQRLLSARDPSTARRACLAGALFLLPLAALVALAGMSARVLLPALPASGDFAQAEALPILVRTALPPLLAGVVLAALVAAVMSTADSALLGASTTTLVDGVRRFLVPSLTERAVLRGVRWATAGIGGIAVGLALWARSLVGMLELVAAVYAGAVFAPLVLGLRWRRANERGALLGMVASAALAIGWRASGLEARTGIHMLLLSLPVGFAVTAAGSLPQVKESAG